jgi:hydroxymethylbilane synthase
MLRIATRKSPLALQQANLVAKNLQKIWPKLKIELVPMTTQGDELLDKKLLGFGGKGLFVKELELALIDRRADIAVHSMKDVPASLPAGLILNTICKRDNPYDAFVSHQFKNLSDLAPKSVIGTASLRRQAQLLAYRPDIEVKMLRGNINTRLEKLKQGDFDAIILACAGLERMNFNALINQIIPTSIMLPACGQGAIGIECRENDKHIQEIIAPLHCEETATCVAIERTVNRLLGGHCHVPIAIFSKFLAKDTIELEARVYDAKGLKKLLWKKSFGVLDALESAKACADDLLAQGALELIRHEP